MANVLSAPDLKCPLCGKHLTIWLHGDVPLYRCSICGGLGFKVGKGVSKEPPIGGRKIGTELALDCPGCGGKLNKVTVGKLKMDRCADCDWVFIEDVADLEMPSIGGMNDCSHYRALLESLVRRYEAIISQL